MEAAEALVQKSCNFQRPYAWREEAVADALGDRAGKVMALRFGWRLPFKQPVCLDRLRQMGVSHPQTVTAIDFATFLEICREGEKT